MTESLGTESERWGTDMDQWVDAGSRALARARWEGAGNTTAPDDAVMAERTLRAVPLGRRTIGDHTMSGSLLGRATALRVKDLTLPVFEVGLDYVLAGKGGVVLAPTSRAILGTISNGSMPESAERSLAEVLSEWAASDISAEIHTVQGAVLGRLLSAADDHVILQGALGEVILGVEAISWVKILPKR